MSLIGEDSLITTGSLTGGEQAEEIDINVINSKIVNTETVNAETVNTEILAFEDYEIKEDPISFGNLLTYDKRNSLEMSRASEKGFIFVPKVLISSDRADTNQLPLTTKSTFEVQSNTSSSSNYPGMVTLKNGDSFATESRATIALGGRPGISPKYQFIHTEHGTGAAQQKLKLYTNDGTSTNPIFPADAVLGVDISNGKIGVGKIVSSDYDISCNGDLSVGSIESSGNVECSIAISTSVSTSNFLFNNSTTLTDGSRYSAIRWIGGSNGSVPFNTWLRSRSGGASPQGAAGIIFSEFDSAHYFNYVDSTGVFNIRHSVENSATPQLSLAVPLITLSPTEFVVKQGGNDKIRTGTERANFDDGADSNNDILIMRLASLFTLVASTPTPVSFTSILYNTGTFASITSTPVPAVGFATLGVYHISWGVVFSNTGTNNFRRAYIKKTAGAVIRNIAGSDANVDASPAGFNILSGSTIDVVDLINTSIQLIVETTSAVNVFGNAQGHETYLRIRRVASPPVSQSWE